MARDNRLRVESGPVMCFVSCRGRSSYRWLVPVGTCGDTFRSELEGGRRSC